MIHKHRAFWLRNLLAVPLILFSTINSNGQTDSWQTAWSSADVTYEKVYAYLGESVPYSYTILYPKIEYFIKSDGGVGLNTGSLVWRFSYQPNSSVTIEGKSYLISEFPELVKMGYQLNIGSIQIDGRSGAGIIDGCAVIEMSRQKTMYEGCLSMFDWKSFLGVESAEQAKERIQRGLPSIQAEPDFSFIGIDIEMGRLMRRMVNENKAREKEEQKNQQEQNASSDDTDPENGTEETSTKSAEQSGNTQNYSNSSQNYSSPGESAQRAEQERIARQKMENERAVQRMDQSYNNFQDSDRRASQFSSDMGSALAGADGGIGARLGTGDEYLGTTYPITYGVSFGFITGYGVNEREENKRMPIGFMSYANMSESIDNFQNDFTGAVISFGASLGIGVFRLNEIMPTLGIRYQSYEYEGRASTEDDNIDLWKIVPSVGIMGAFDPFFISVDYIPHFNAIEFGVGINPGAF